MSKYGVFLIRFFMYFGLKVASKPFSKMLPMTTFGFERSASTSQKMTSTLLIKNLQNSEKCHCPMFRTYIFNFKVAWNHFLKWFLWPTLNLNRFECFAWFSQKMISTSPLKNLRNNDTYHFSRLRTFVFDPK